MSQEQPPVEASKATTETAKAEPQVQAKAETAKVDPPVPDIAALIKAAVSSETAPYVEQARIAALAGEHNLSLGAANKVAAYQKDNPKLSFAQALLLAKAESPNDFATRSSGFNFLPVGGDSSMRDKGASEKTNEQKYDEAIDLANNGANGSRVAAANVMRTAVRQFLELQVARARGVAI